MKTRLGWIALTAALTGCAAGPGYYSPSHPEYRYYDGSDTRAYNEPRYYGDSGARYYEGRPCQPGLNTGHVIGGVVGGVLGNQVGKGNGRTAATVAAQRPRPRARVQSASHRRSLPVPGLARSRPGSGK